MSHGMPCNESLWDELIGMNSLGMNLGIHPKMKPQRMNDLWDEYCMG